ncbi:MAG: 50S ribosomal protein L9 [Candidatus Aureabacteria bacterium]|nr:50S ribosomal protein L9 [Candidatus Auribacterota bacterium]
METEIILMRDVDGLGKQGDIKKVSPGYARNYLFPNNLAAPATPKHIKMLELENKRRDAEAKRAVDKLREEGERLSHASCTIISRAGEDEMLFGSVTSQDIADSLAQTGFTIDKRQITLEEPIKKLGVYHVEVKLHADVSASVKVWVVAK